FNYRDQIPGVNGPDGKPLAKNPFQDIRVRKALSLAVDRQRIADRIMAGTAVPASQPQPPGGHAFDTSLKPDPYDPDRAKALLAEAGYKDGFSVMVTAPDARWGNDKAITEAVVQMLNRIGIKAELDIVPNAVYPTKAQKGETPFFLGAWGTPSGDGGNFLTHGIHSFDEVAKLGAANWGRYSNKAVDDLIDKSNIEADPAKREGLVRDAWRTATNDMANIWILWVANTWASKAELTVEPRIDAFTMGTTIAKK
ncbi:MAG: ABC transporter substrate-binding protein, partial [Rhodospirillales bacterium]|nr:ABC transporter substrate-binding protein [Rhodospirillales bacterium]